MNNQCKHSVFITFPSFTLDNRCGGSNFHKEYAKDMHKTDSVNNNN